MPPAEQIRAEGDAGAVLERLFQNAPVSPDWFAPSFLTQISPDTVAAVINDLKQRHGALRAIAADHGALVVQLAGADVPTELTLDAHGRIAALRFQPAVPVVPELADAVSAIAALPGRTAALVATDGHERAAHNAAVPLAVGSAFKLAVLRATATACEAGRLAWEQVVRLDPAWRSLPSGILQDWPDRAPLTIATLANLMIALSDNTATDALIHLAGREAVGALSPRNVPFLTTREAFILKAVSNGTLQQEWVAADPATRRAFLAAVAGLKLPPPGDLAPGATSEIEWFLTAEELCALLDATHELPSLGINQGPVAPGRWRSVAYKGGSETGVLNLSALVVAHSGKRHCVVATWNDTAVLDAERLTAPFRALLRWLGNEG